MHPKKNHLLAVAVFAMLTLLGSDNSRQYAAPSVEASDVCFSTYAFGTGDNFMKICFSADGNLVQFESPAGSEHIRIGSIGEGYLLCSRDSLPPAGTEVVHGFDAGFAESGFGPPTITQPNGPNTLPLTITRDTTDGVFRLTQRLSRSTALKDVSITMTLTNISPMSRFAVSLHRYFDGDIDNVVDNLYDKTDDSVWGRHSSHGLMLSAMTFETPHETAVEKASDWDPTNPAGSQTAQTCTGSAELTPAGFGDFVGRLVYLFNIIDPGRSKTVKVLYRRI